MNPKRFFQLVISSYQLVSWFPEWYGFQFIRLDPDKDELGWIFEWVVFLGFWELRKWNLENAETETP